MSESVKGQQPAREQPFLRRIHEPAKKYLKEWLDVPAHVHHVAHRMANPPIERPLSRNEFQQLLQCFEVTDENTFVSESFGYGVRIEANGDRLVLVWEAHTEYYSYQIWHIPDDKTIPLEFGPITFPN